MDQYVQCNLTYRETSEKKSQENFKFKTNSKHKGIQVNISSTVNKTSEELSLCEPISKLSVEEEKKVETLNSNRKRKNNGSKQCERNPKYKNALTIGCIGALQEINQKNNSVDKSFDEPQSDLLRTFSNISGTTLNNPLESVSVLSPAKLYSSNNPKISDPIRSVLPLIEERKDLEFVFIRNSLGSCYCLEVFRKDSLQDIGGVYEVPVRIKFSSEGIVSVNLLFKSVIHETYWDAEIMDVDPVPVFRALNYLKETNIFCSGIKKDLPIAKHKSLEIIHHPCERWQSKHCPVLFRKTKVQSSVASAEKGSMCPKCSALEKYLTRRRKTIPATPRTKLRRRCISSKFPIQDLTPKSRNIRIKNLRNERYRQKKRLRKLEKDIKENSVTLNTEQSYELAQVLSDINVNHKNDVKRIILEVKKQNPLLAKAFKISWDTDSENTRLGQILKDQGKNLGTSTGNRWSALTYRLALTLYSRSPASYRALKSLRILNLPSVHTIKRKVQKFKCGAGIDVEHLQKESMKFKSKFEQYDEIKKPPQDGFLVLDEVKVIGKMVWNANTNEFIGLAMDKNEIPSLQNFYKSKSLNECLAAQYVLQYIWRCTGDKFDVIGPFFPSAFPFSHEQLTVLTQKCIFAFQSVGFLISAIICDGASSNLKMIKSTHGVTGQYSFATEDNGSYNFEVQPRFKNPLLPDRWIYWIICPSHQLKNLINGLSHSKEDGTRSFEKGGVSFGWKQVQDVEAREDIRKDNLELSQVKGLRHSYIERDAWTKLNVTPAKILQQKPFLNELFNYANPNSHFLPNNDEAKRNENNTPDFPCDKETTIVESPHDSKEVMACYDFLSACHNLFEAGFLSHKKVFSLDSEPVRNILKGYKYFESWAIETIKSGKLLSGKEGKCFLAWQTWDLLRVMVFGFLGFVKDFHERYKTFYMYPVKVNGSIVESFFSQLRFITAGKLTSINYKTARRSLLISADMKSPAKTVKTGENIYRNVELDVSSILDCTNVGQETV